jgi:hypothetical protein
MSVGSAMDRLLTETIAAHFRIHRPSSTSSIVGVD